jgi:DNA-binding transcriptional regulator LsrR (DeoR family)
VDDRAQEIEPEASQEILKNTFTVDLPVLQEFALTSPVWLLATGEHKQHSVYVALTGGLGNCLVIDANIARYLLELAS